VGTAHRHGSTHGWISCAEETTMTFDGNIAEVRRSQLCDILALLERQEGIVPTYMVVAFMQNMFAIGGPDQFSFVGQDAHGLFVGEIARVFVPRWIFFGRESWDGLSVSRLGNHDRFTDAAKVLLAAELSSGVERSADRNMVDDGSSGICCWAGSHWRSCDPCGMYIDETGHQDRVMRSVGCLGAIPRARKLGRC
jgi:hypothetical protein